MNWPCTRCHGCRDQTPIAYMPLTYRITSLVHYYDSVIFLMKIFYILCLFYILTTGMHSFLQGTNFIWPISLVTSCQLPYCTELDLFNELSTACTITERQYYVHTWSLTVISLKMKKQTNTHSVSEESSFHFSVYVTSHNNRQWFVEKPTLIHKGAIHDINVAVWCGTSATRITEFISLRT